MPDKIAGPNNGAVAPGAAPAGNVIKRLAPGAPGTRRLHERYRDALVCVRYREDPTLGRRYTTVELVVDQRPFAVKEDLVRIGFGERELREQAKAAGGRWDPQHKLWRLPRPATRALGLTKRVVKKVD